MAVLPFVAFAQEETKKQYIPEKGDWAIGFDAAPVLNFVGNAFNNSNTNNVKPLGGTATISSSQMTSGRLMPTYSLMGKYMLTDEFAVRANIGILVNSATERSYVTDQKALLANPFSEDKVIDSKTTNQSGASLLLGAEYRKGERRVQGVFGAGLLIAMTKEATAYEYGNGMSKINQRPETSFGTSIYTNGYRPLKEHNVGAEVLAGVAGSAGIEWFVAPKISLGAEMSLTAYYKFGTQTYKESEGYNAATDKVEIRTDILAPGSRGLHIGTESLGASLYMMFYF